MSLSSSDLSIDTDENEDPKALEIPGGGGGKEKREGSKI